jgi:hypothetical protein
LKADVAHTGFSGLVRLFKNVKEDDPTSAYSPLSVLRRSHGACNHISWTSPTIGRIENRNKYSSVVVQIEVKINSLAVLNSLQVRYALQLHEEEISMCFVCLHLDFFVLNKCPEMVIRKAIIIASKQNIFNKKAERPKCVSFQCAWFLSHFSKPKKYRDPKSPKWCTGGTLIFFLSIEGYNHIKITSCIF